MRHGLNKNLGFSPEDRTENIRRIGEVAKLMVDAGSITVTAFISPYKQDRDNVRAILEDGEFIEVYTKCSVEECEKRDPKGLYKKARSGEIPEFTGISAPYEAPDHPEIILDTEHESIDQSVDRVIQYLKQHQYIYLTSMYVNEHTCFMFELLYVYTYFYFENLCYNYGKRLQNTREFNEYDEA